jgi:SLT domain-containing protein
MARLNHHIDLTNQELTNSMKVFTLAAGLAVGYVLGSRAGRDKYEQIVATVRKAQTHPAVTQVQDKAKQLLDSASATSASDTDPQQVTISTAAVTEPTPRSSRRQSKSSVTVPDVAIDPLA